MQKFSKEELQDQAAKFMAAHNVDSFLATEDGNFFHPNDKSLAHDHNFKNVKGEVYEFGKEAPAAKDAAAKKAVKEHDVDTHGDADEVAKAAAAAAKAAADKAAAEKKAAAKAAADAKKPAAKK